MKESKVAKNSYITKDNLWNKNFVLLLQGQFLSIFGDNIYDMALRIWILSETGSLAIMGFFMAITTIPKVIISPFAGTFVDRHNRRNVLITCDIICGVSVTFVGIVAITGALEIWMLCLVGIIVGICSCFFSPTINSIMPYIVSKSNLIKANSILSLVNTGDDMLGNAIGGFLVQAVGAPISFLLNGISFLFSAVSEVFIKVKNVEVKINESNFFQDLKEGLLYINNSKGIKHIYIITCFMNFFAAMSMTLTLPWFTENTSLGVGIYGVAMAINAAGMFLGFSFLSTLQIKKENKFNVFIASGLIVSITMIIYAFTLNIFVISIMFFINGFALAIINSFCQFSIQVNVPSEMLSKAFAFQKTLSSALIPLGMILAGVLGEIIQINYIIFIDYIMFFILFVYTFSLSSVKKVIEV